MKKTILSALFAVAACGGSGGGSGGAGSVGAAPKDLSKFTGTPWNVNATITLSCPSGTRTFSGSTTSTYVAGTGGADLQYTTQTSGCLFKFTVNDAGTAASLSNGPVTCSFTDKTTGAVFVQVTTSETDTTSDGHHLTIAAAGTLSSGAVNCQFTETDSGTR